MWFVRLSRLARAPNKDVNEWFGQKMAEAQKMGITLHHSFFTLGEYDFVSIFEAPDEKVAMKFAMLIAPESKGQTLVAVSPEEVAKWPIE